MSAENTNSAVGSIASSATYDSENLSIPPESQIEIIPKTNPSTTVVLPFSVVYETGPCSRCNLSLKNASEIISYIGMVFAIILVIAGASVFAEEPIIVDQSLIIFDPKAKAKDTESMTNALEYSSVINLCRGFYDLILYPMLWMGAVCCNRRICIVWMFAKMVLFAILLIGTGFAVLLFGHAYIPMCPLILLIPEFYFLWVVLCFSEELKVFGDIVQNKTEQELVAATLTKEIQGPETPTGDKNKDNSGKDIEDFSAASVTALGAVKSQSSGSLSGGWSEVFGDPHHHAHPMKKDHAKK